jgi:histidinol-phosphate aminotransferase
MPETITELIARLVRPEIRALSAYHVPDAAGLIKLDAMENPYGWPEEMKRAWLDVLHEVAINRYPEPDAPRLKRALRKALGVPAGMEILLGNGSDELIQIVALAVAGTNRAVLAPVPTFVMYEMIATFAGMRYVGVPLGADFALDRNAMLAAIEREQPALVFLAYPNNPTGNLFAREDVEAVIRAAPGLVVVDEAYHAFAQESFLSRLPAFPNLLVMRTLSKQGLAGLRLGMLMGDPRLLAEFDKVRLPYNINVLTQASAAFALEHLAVLDEQAARIRAERERLYAAMRAVHGLTVWPSRANFLLFRASGRLAADVHESLKRGGVLIKNLDPQGGALKGCLRVTVGMPAENDAFLRVLGNILKA